MLVLGWLLTSYMQIYICSPVEETVSFMRGLNNYLFVEPTKKRDFLGVTGKFIWRSHIPYLSHETGTEPGERVKSV